MSNSEPDDGPPDQLFDPRDGLCPGCRHVKIVESHKGKTFFLCKLSSTDARYRKYPPQPVFACKGHETSG